MSDPIEERAWFSEADYREGLAPAPVAPRPIAAQLALYLGYLRHRAVPVAPQQMLEPLIAGAAATIGMVVFPLLHA